MGQGWLLTVMWRQAGARCLAEVELPAFRIREAITGEVVQGEQSWQGRVDRLAPHRPYQP